MIKQMLFQLLCYGTYGVKIALINNVNMIIYHVKISQCTVTSGYEKHLNKYLNRSANEMEHIQVSNGANENSNDMRSVTD